MGRRAARGDDAGRHRAHLHLTLTDDDPWALAVVMIEALPERDEA